MKIIHKNGFTDEEKSSFKAIIFNNIMSAIRTLVKASQDLNIKVKAKVGATSSLVPFFLTYFQAAAAKVMNGNEEYFSGPLSSDLVEAIKELWQDSGIRATFEESSKFQLIDSAP